MAIKITLFITLLLYAFIVAQSFFYILAMSNVSKKMGAAAYIESRKMIDAELRSSLVTVYYLALAASISLMTFCVVNPEGILFITSVIALLMLIIDIVISLKGNIPLNNMINKWSEDNYPNNWTQYRDRWFSLYHVRQAANITGFIALVTGLILSL